MKKLILFICSVMVLPSAGQIGETGWKLGGQLGISGNSARFTSGMEEANGRFRQNSFGAVNLTFMARYDYNRHWAFEGGVGVTTFGFDYSIAENYSLIRDKNKVSTSQVSFTALELPIDVIYKFNPNCKNSRWVLGAGLSPTFREKYYGDFCVVTDQVIPGNFQSASSNFTSSGFVLLRYSVGREKTFRNGSIFRVSFQVNVGFSDVATSTVYYKLDNISYNHTFKNNGSSAGIRFSYFLMSKRLSN